MRRRSPGRATRAEQAYIGELKRVSAFEMRDQGRARLLAPDEYPDPLKRFLARERTIVHVRLPAAIKRRLDARSRSTGVPAQELARRWIEQGIERDAG